LGEAVAVPTWKTWTALVLVYVVWGSTYLAIRYAVEGGLPPLLAAGARHGVAALLLAGFVLVRRGGAPFRAPWRAWRNGAVVGLLLLLGGNGGVMVAEDQHLPSGLAALLVAGVPLFVVALRWLSRDRPTPRTLLGVGVGFCGLAVLLLPGSRPQGVAVVAALTVVLASFLWSIGSFWAGRAQLPADALVTAVAEMVGGSVGCAVGGLLHGERFSPGVVTPKAWWALAYLVVLGSVVAFTAYSWLLGTAPVSQVATYAYVNPVVAVLLGALLADEQLTLTSVVGGLVTLVAVYLVVTEEGRRRRRVPAEPYVPTERQGRLRSSAT
jgi:drug/metabolite transporter (DMT)-like permease